VAHLSRVHIFFLLAGLLSFLVYLQTLAPTITWRNEGDDSGDLAAAVAVGGVPHPPGYPTYLLLGSAFNLLPFGDTAYRLNLLSATCAALTIVVLGLTLFKTLSRAGSEVGLEGGRLAYICALAASLTLAFSALFWSQAVIAEVYTLNTFFAALLLYGTLQLQPANERWLFPALAGLLGLSLGNHLSILCLVPLLLGIKISWSWPRLVTAGLAFVIGLSIYLIIPLRAATWPPINWGAATTWPNFFWLVTAEPYRSLPFTLPWRFIPVRVGVELRLLVETFMGWGIPIGLVGLRQLFKRDRRLATTSLLAFGLISIYAIGYNTTDSYIYLLPACLIFAWWLGCGLYHLLNGLPGLTFQRLAMGAAILLPLLSLWLNFAGQDLSQDYAAYNYAQQNLEPVPAKAIILVEADPQTFALWYGRYGLGLRPDVAVVNSNLLAYSWYRQLLHRAHAPLLLTDQAGQPATTLSTFIDLNLAHSPLYLAASQTATLEGYRLEPFNGLHRVVELD
jgi:hypothetical protein